MRTRTIDIALLAALAIGLVAAAAAASVALFMIGDDGSQSGEFLDGVGLMAGGALLVLVGVPAGLAVRAGQLVLTGRPRGSAFALAAGLTGLGAAGLLTFVSRSFAPGLVAGALLSVVAVAAVVAEGRTS